MPDKPHYTAAQMIAALQATKGLVFLAAKRLGCAPQTVRNYMQRYPSVQTAVELERGQMVDLAELKLWQAIQNGEPWGISLCLRSIGRDRGYGDQVALQHSGTVTHVLVDALTNALQQAERSRNGQPQHDVRHG